MFNNSVYYVTDVNIHLFIQAVVHDQVVGHTDSMRLHDMPGAIKVIANLGYSSEKHAQSQLKSHVKTYTRKRTVVVIRDSTSHFW
jgi:methyl coenzyme M reductase subunit C-like uncharacterized protein (methanogenesis marker protein 7)